MTVRAAQEISVLNEIGGILSSTLELRDGFGKMMQIISSKLNMHRGALVLLDESTGRLRTEAAAGMSPEEIEKGKYALGEGRRDAARFGRPRRTREAHRRGRRELARLVRPVHGGGAGRDGAADVSDDDVTVIGSATGPPGPRKQ